MGKVSGSYESVVRGVSEQNPQSRRSGQHFAQVNMVSDPVRGVARRHGSLLQHEKKIAGVTLANATAQTTSTRVFPFFVDGVEYDFIARTKASDGGRTTFAWCFNKETRQFIPVSMPASADAVLDTLVSGGVSAVANVGRYLYVAGNDIVPEATTVDAWGTPANQQKLVAWVRGGAYSRTFKVTLTKTDNTKIVGEYTTFAASYPGVLDTSDILAEDPPGTPNPNYQKEVNDRTNEYNSAVTAYIGEAAQDITPENIAEELHDALVLAGVADADVNFNGGYVIVDSALYKEIEIDDSGDDSLVRSVGNVIKNLDLVSSRHFVGKVVKVEPDDSNGDPVYLKAFARDEISTGFAEVVWRETAGVIQTPTTVFCFATVEEDIFYLAGSSAGLQTISGVPDVPGYMANNVGDDVSAPLPTIFGRRIDMMAVFQDRLVMAAGGTVFFSRPGDYLNWFRQSVTTIEDDDPAEGFPLGAEDDTIKFSALYDRSLLMYGRRYQYIVSGRSVITPQTLSIPIVSAYEDAIDASPLSSGNFVFYTKFSGIPGREVTSMHQVQPGLVADVSDSYTASQVLDTFLGGKPVELATLTAPNMVLLRTDRDRRKLFTYSYLDDVNNGQRLFDAWSYWTWHASVGEMVGVSTHSADILVYTLRGGPDRVGATSVWIACEKFVRDTDLSDYPYLDSIRPLSTYQEPEAETFLNDNSADLGNAAVAIGRGVDKQFLGDNLLNLDRFLLDYADQGADSYVGYQYDSHITPTNPYARDRNDQAILGGRLTLGKVQVGVTDTGAMKVTVETRNQTRESLRFIGRLIAQPIDLIGRQPIVTTTLSAFVGGEVSECKYTLASIRWLPLTVNAINWTGQFFFNTRRV